MNHLPFDIASIDIPVLKRTYYFIYNTRSRQFESKGVDLSTAVYLLLLKLRPYKEQFGQYLEMLHPQEFDLRKKDYFFPDQVIDLAQQCMYDKDGLYREWPEPLNIKNLDPTNELKCLEYVGKYNPQRKFYGIFSTPEAESTSVNNHLLKYFKPQDQSEADLTDFSLQMALESLKLMIKNIYGEKDQDSGKMEISQLKLYSYIYKKDGMKILRNEDHLTNVEYVRCALSCYRNDPYSLQKLYGSLPFEIKNNDDVCSFYEWHYTVI